MNYLVIVLILGSVLLGQNPKDKRPPRPFYKPSPMLGFYKMKTPAKHYGEMKEAALDKQKSLLKNSPFKTIDWQLIGPTEMGGRITDIAVPTDSYFKYYVASAAGGVWKTENNGTTWEPIFNDYSSSTIGDIAVAPSNSEILWVGTGENNSLRSSYSGTGVYKSIDGGKTFKNMGLLDSHHIGRIIIHPTNPEIVYVASIGHLYTSNEERGIYKTIDGGQNWAKVLDKGSDIGFIDITFSANNPGVLFAAAWERSRKAWNFVEAGRGSGIYKSTDEGKTWSKKTNGFPDNQHVGRIGFGTTPANPNVIYAMLDNQAMAAPASEAEKKFSSGTTNNEIDSILTSHQMYRSNDLGETWKLMSDRSKKDLFTGPYGYFFGNMAVDPNDENTLYSLDLNLRKSTDGGKTWINATKNSGVHGDHHALWINPNNSNHMINGNDGGVDLSYDAGKSWQAIQNLPIAQFYTISVDNETPYNIYGGMQDNGTWRGSSHVKSSDGDVMGLSNSNKWEFLTGGDGFYVQVDPTDKDIFYSESQWGNVSRTVHGKRKSIKPRSKKKDEKYRFNWSSPILLSEHNRFTLYFGGNKLFKSLNQGDDWKEVSPDLSYADTTKTGDVTFGTITSITESPFDADLLYVGTDDGRVWRTDNGGTTWEHLDDALPNKWVTRVIASKYDENRVYLSLSGYREDLMDNYLFSSEDRGKTWNPISSNLPAEPVNVIREDYKNKNVLYAGTDLGVYYSKNLGKSWISMRNNLPTTAVHDIIQHPREGDLLIATHGRSIYKFPATIVSQLTDSISTNVESYLFDLDKVTYGYSMELKGYYSLNEKQDVKIEILDKDKKLVKSISNKEQTKGVYSFYWDGKPNKPKSRWDIVKKGKYYVSIESDGDDIVREIDFK